MKNQNTENSKKSAEQINSQNEMVRVVSEFAVSLASAQVTEDIFKVIAEKLMDITDASAVGVSVYDKTDNTLTVKHLSLRSGTMAKLNELVGKSIFDMKMVISADMMKRMLSEIVGISDDLSETTFGAIPRPVAMIVQKVFGVDRFVGLSLQYGNELMGTVLIAFRKGQEMFHPDMLQAFTSIAAVAMQREKAEYEAKKSLKKSEERYRSALEGMMEGCQIIGYDWKYLYLNETAIRQGRKRKEEMLGRTMMETYPGIENTEMFSTLRQCMEKRAPQQMLNEFTFPDGSKGFFDLSFQPVPEGVFILSLDMTERKRAEDALRLAGAYNRSLIEASIDPLVTIGQDGKITDVNSATENATGYSKNELVGKDSSDFFTEPEKARAGYQLVFREGKVRDYPLELKHRDGHVVSVLYNASVYRDEMGNVIGVFAAARDITERKKAEDALKESEEKYRTIFNLAPEVIVLFDLDGQILDVNNYGEGTTGLKRSDLVGKSITELSDIIPEDEIEGYLDKLAQVLRGKSIEPFVVPVTGKDGKKHWFETRVSLVSIEGKPFAVQLITTDITERRTRETELKRTMEELIQMNRELKQFAYVASHDLQEPLRTISSFVQLIEKRYKGKLDSDADEFVAFIVDGVARMQNMINGLLQYSRIATRGRPFTMTDCEKVLNDAMSNLMVAIEDAKGTVTHDPLPKILADESQLVTLFQNLISNALKFRGTEPPAIHISARTVGDNWEFSVKDNGIGIDPQYWDKIFIIFQRLHTQQEYPGMGIGLAICKKILDRHSGRIWVQSEKGKGTTFYFTIPVLPNPGGAAA